MKCKIIRDKYWVETHKISAIKNFKDVFGMGLIEAKDYTESFIENHCEMKMDLSDREINNLRFYGYTVIPEYRIELPKELFEI
jgi:ribosomal protein L7/L12